MRNTTDHGAAKPVATGWGVPSTAAGAVDAGSVAGAEVAGAEDADAEGIAAVDDDAGGVGGGAVQPARRIPAPMAAAVRVQWRMRFSNQ